MYSNQHFKRWRGAARLTRDRWIPVSREFEHQSPPLFHWARNFTLIA